MGGNCRNCGAPCSGHGGQWCGACQVYRSRYKRDRPAGLVAAHARTDAAWRCSPGRVARCHTCRTKAAPTRAWTRVALYGGDKVIWLCSEPCYDKWLETAAITTRPERAA